MLFKARGRIMEDPVFYCQPLHCRCSLAEPVPFSTEYGGLFEAPEAVWGGPVLHQK